jgi:MFS superfamily sulfate permease-like transporter
MALGLVHAGYITVYLSDQLIRGFTTASAVFVLTAQLNKVLNVKLARYDGVGSLFFVRTPVKTNVQPRRLQIYRDLVYSLPKSSWITVVMSCAAICALYILKEYVNEPFKRRFHVPIPFELFTVTCQLRMEMYDLSICRS